MAFKRQPSRKRPPVKRRVSAIIHTPTSVRRVVEDYFREHPRAGCETPPDQEPKP